MKDYWHGERAADPNDMRRPIVYLFRLPGVAEPFRAVVADPVTVSPRVAAIGVDKWTGGGWHPVGFIEAGDLPSGTTSSDRLQIAKEMAMDLFGPELSFMERYALDVARALRAGAAVEAKEYVCPQAAGSACVGDFSDPTRDVCGRCGGLRRRP